MPLENIDWDQLSPEEKNCIKEWSVKKEKELLMEVMRLQPTSAIFPLGRDRTYRRYWVFNSVPGIFVEDDEEFVPDCCLLSVEQHVTKAVERMAQKQLTERGKIKWSFYWTLPQLDDLISALNPRGFREGPLRLALIEHRHHLAEVIPNCDSAFLSSAKVEEKFNGIDSLEFKVEDCKVEDCKVEEKFQLVSAVDSLLEKALREMILDIEERIHFGSLGSLKVSMKYNLCLLLL